MPPPGPLHSSRRGAEGKWRLPCLDPPTEPSTVLELHEALFSWDPTGTSQKTFISHLQVKKVCETDSPGEFPDKQDAQINTQGLMLLYQECRWEPEGRGGARCAGSSLRGDDPLCVHHTPTLHCSHLSLGSSHPPSPPCVSLPPAVSLSS